MCVTWVLLHSFLEQLLRFVVEAHGAEGISPEEKARSQELL
jgi:hypothetical protein